MRLRALVERESTRRKRKVAYRSRVPVDSGSESSDSDGSDSDGSDSDESSGVTSHLAEEKARRRKQKAKEKERARKAKREGEGARRGRAQPEPEPQAFDMTVIDADAEAEAAEAERRERARAGARTPQTPPKSTTSDPNDMSERPASRRVRPLSAHEKSVLAAVHKPSAVG